MNETQFKQALKDQGYGEAERAEYRQSSAKDMHVHDITAFVYVVSGEFVLRTEDGTKSHQPGDTCEVAAGTLHTEETGPDGATVLIARK